MDFHGFTMVLEDGGKERDGGVRVKAASIVVAEIWEVKLGFSESELSSFRCL